MAALKQHPEQKSDESFLGNATMKSYLEIGHTTKRWGVVAYDRSGNTIPSLRPVFVMTAELVGKGFPETPFPD